MKNLLKNNKFFILVSLIIIGILSYVVANQYKSENFRQCVCQSAGSGRERACQDTTEVNNLYVTGQLTETSKLPDRGWSTVSPGDMNFPVSNGCAWMDYSKQPEWQKWDFTDFGN